MPFSGVNYMGFVGSSSRFRVTARLQLGNLRLQLAIKLVTGV
jgi:hypothetical protein